MNTITRLENLGITIEASEDTIADICRADRFDVTYEDVKAMSKEERRALRDEADAILNLQDMNNWDMPYHCYSVINSVEDEEYREENWEKFKAYEARMNEPDFDWDYYSDWHKDMFGYRPHFKAIPVDEESRERMCRCWHAERGL